MQTEPINASCEVNSGLEDPKQNLSIAEKLCKIVMCVSYLALITPNFMSGSSHEIVGDYFEKQMLVQHFSQYYSQRCRCMVPEVAGVINPSVGAYCCVSTHK